MLNPDQHPSSPPPSSPPPTRSSARSAYAGNGELILVADDQDTVRELLETILNNNGYRTVAAADGTEASQLFSARQAEIAAVITDIHMPRTTSEYVGELFRRIRKDIPVLLISGLGTEEDPRGNRDGASRDPFLLKPFRPAALLEAVFRLLHPEAPPKT